MTETILLCTDLDRTILPNGHLPESDQARALFTSLASHPQLLLTYVSGRDKSLLLEAIQEYQLPIPDFAIGDVGSTIYEINHQWQKLDSWHTEIAPDWAGMGHDQITQLFLDIKELKLQEDTKQNRYKLSYYLPADVDTTKLLPEMENRLHAHGVQANLIWSIDDIKTIGLLDILPRSANKLHAIQFLRRKLGITQDRMVFAGDSGNDLPVLSSGLKSILVANAREDVRLTAQQSLAAQNLSNCLYLPKGGYLGMNGNYAAGVLEGVAHFFPETTRWLNP